MTDTYTYDAFGATKTHTGTSANVWKFTAEQNDTTVNQSPYYLRARYYDPLIGRFLTRDPFKGFTLSPQSQNRYVYNANDPVDLVDPYGLCGWRSVGDALDCGKKAVQGAGRNAEFLFEFTTGTGSADRYYGQDSAQVRGLRGSPAAEKIRNDFIAKGCVTADRLGWGTNRAYRYSLLRWPPRLLNPMVQMGGVAGASVSKEGNGMIRIHIENYAGWESFTNGWMQNNPFDEGGPLRTIHQTLEWYEPLPAACLD